MNVPLLIDSHCHLNIPPLSTDLQRVIAESRRVGVDTWVVPGIAPDAWDGIARLAAEVPGVVPAFGVHPLWAHTWNGETEADLRRLAAVASAIGEIGLDYALPGADRARQRSLFRAQLGIARSARLPVLIHCRKAFGDCLAILREELVSGMGGIMHSFSGSLEVARECMALGLLIGVAGPVTYGGARRLPGVVAAVGPAHLALETDAPDLTPLPLPREANIPANLPLIAAKVAMLCGSSTARVAEATSANVRRVLRLP